MDWASHGTLNSKLSAHIQVVLVPSTPLDEPDPCRLSESKQCRRVQGGVNRMMSTWGQEGFPCLFKHSRVVLPRGFVLAFGSPDRAACWIHAMCVCICVWAIQALSSSSYLPM